jgi:hypothetical protein
LGAVADLGKGNASFLKKKKQKTLLIWVGGVATAVAQTNKSFLRAFFQKSAAFLFRRFYDVRGFTPP